MGMNFAFGILNRAWDAWREAGKAPPLRKPTALQFPINDICNSRCQMCRIWERKRDEEISPEQLARVLADPLFSEVENVGMNGGEPTLRPDLAELAGVLISRLPRLRGISLITNAIREKRVIAAVDELGGLCVRNGKKLDVMVSLDGVGAVHDRVRGVPGNFQSAVRVLEHVRSTPLVASHRIGCTIVAENVFDVENVLAFARDKEIYARFRLGIPHPRLYSAGLMAPFSLGPEALFHVAAFLDTLIERYEREEGRRAFYASLRNQLTDNSPRRAGCAWRSHAATLGPRGEFSYCAVASPVLGNVNDASASGLYWGGREVLDEIRRTKCAACRHDYEGVGERRVLVKRWAKRAAGTLPGPGEAALKRVWQDARERWRFATRSRAAAAPLTSCRKGPPEILLCGWYGTETLGDRAILSGLCALLRDAAPDAVVDVASLRPYVTRETARLMPELGLRQVRSLRDAEGAAAGGKYSAVAVAGGPLMTPISEVIDLARLFSSARNAGAQTALLGCGLGPIQRGGPRFSAVRELVRTASLCLLRDSASARMAEELGRGEGATDAPDPAWFWPALARRPRVERGAGRPSRIAVALRDWPIEEYAAGKMTGTRAAAVKRRLENELLRFVDTVVAAGAELLPVCMHTLSAGGDDRDFYWRLFANRPELARLVPSRRRPPVEEAELYHNSDAVLAMRFHSNVFALALGKPMLGLDYTLGGKIGALLEESGNGDRLLALETFDGEAAALRLLKSAAECDEPSVPDLSAGRRAYVDHLRRWLFG